MDCQDWRHELYQHCPTCEPDEYQRDLAAAPQPSTELPSPHRQAPDSTHLSGYSDTY